MNKRLTRHDMVQPDEFVTTVEHGVVWFERNWRLVATLAAAAVGAVLLIWAVSGWISSKGHAADVVLGEAMGLMGAPLLAPGELPPLTGETTFGSARERDEAVLARLDELLANFSSSKAAASAGYLRGAVLLRLDRPEEAREALSAFLESRPGSSLAPAAKRSLAAAELASGRPDEAIAVLQELVSQPSAMFPVDAALMDLARTQEAAGRLEEALATYRRLVNENPQSVFATEAGQAVARLSRPVPAA